VTATSHPLAGTSRRTYPPVAAIATVALGLVVIGGIVMASYVPRQAPLALPGALLAVAGALMLICVLLLIQLQDFSFDRFFQVFGWALLAYSISAGMIEFAFVRDHTRGTSLLIVTMMLVIFATSVPTTIAFTTARYATPPSERDGQGKEPT